MSALWTVALVLFSMSAGAAIQLAWMWFFFRPECPCVECETQRLLGTEQR